MAIKDWFWRWGTNSTKSISSLPDVATNTPCPPCKEPKKELIPTSWVEGNYEYTLNKRRVDEVTCKVRLLGPGISETTTLLEKEAVFRKVNGLWVNTEEIKFYPLAGEYTHVVVKGIPEDTHILQTN